MTRLRLLPHILLIFLAATALAACTDFSDTDEHANDSLQGGGAAGTTAVAPRPNTAVAQDNDFSNAINNVRPATVQVTSQQTIVNPARQAFTVPAGVGTGVIYKPDGHIITNNHVIEGAESLLVSLPDGRSFEADLVGADPRTDLAVLKIDGGGLPVAELGDSDEISVGDWNVAIGNALGLPGGPTVTVGVVSALDRAAQEPDDSGGPGPVLYGLIQTDASINPGNSGGPLANLDGQVIGINTLVAGQAAEGIQAQGIGFAIAINQAKEIAAELEANGHVDHAFLGVSYVPASPLVAAQLGLSHTEGAVVMEVVPGSPAAQAGIAQGDVIQAVDGEEIEGESDLTRIVDSHDPGDRIALRVARGSNTRDVQVTLGTAPG